MKKEDFKAYMEQDDFFDAEAIEAIMSGIEGAGVYGVNTEYGDYCVNLKEFQSIAEAKADTDADHFEDGWLNDTYWEYVDNLDEELDEAEEAALDARLRAEGKLMMEANPYPKTTDGVCVAYYWGDFNEVVDGKLVDPDLLFGEGWFFVHITE